MGKKVDVLIIGAGSAGLSAMSEIRKKTDNFIIVNAGHYGTSCARVACMPTKALIEAANGCHSRRLLADLGTSGIAQLRISRPAIMRRVMEMRDGFVAGTKKATEELGGKSISGQARFRDPHTVEVAGETISAERIIIATGSSPVFPAAWRKFGDRILTTEDLFYQPDLPETMAVIGLGPSGIELAQALSRLDIEVTAFDAQSMVGGLTDPVVNDSAVKAISGELPIILGAEVELVEAGAQIKITSESKEVQVDKVLLTMGRQPNISDLGLENLEIELDEEGMPPFDPQSMQVADLPVYITGDTNNYRPLLHEAIDEGHIAGYNALQDEPTCFSRRVPLAIAFSEPNIVMVGQRWEELDRKRSVTGAADFSTQSRARMSNSNQGLLHLYADREQGTVLGAEMAAPAGEHLGHLLALAIQKEMTVFEMLKLPYYHPVIEEGFRTAVRDASRQVNRELSETELLLCESMAPRNLS